MKLYDLAWQAGVTNVLLVGSKYYQADTINI